MMNYDTFVMLQKYANGEALMLQRMANGSLSVLRDRYPDTFHKYTAKMLENEKRR